MKHKYTWFKKFSEPMVLEPLALGILITTMCVLIIIEWLI